MPAKTSHRIPPEGSGTPPQARGGSSAPRDRGRRAGIGLLAAVLAAGSALGPGCAPARPPAPPAPPEPFPALAQLDRAFLVPPLTGYPYTVDAARRVRLEEGFAALGRGDEPSARTAAHELLGADPGFHPARVLSAQAALYRSDPTEALDAVRPVTGELPGYLAAQLVRGRAAEEAGEVVEALEAFRAAAATGAPEAAPAAARADEIAPRAAEVVFHRVEDALARGRTAVAAEEVERLREWDPEGEATLRAERALAVAREEPEAELEAIARLAERFPEDRELSERRAMLELEVGDPGTGLALFERLVAEHPGDPGLAAGLEAAKFRWRFLQLPERVTELAERPELSRAGFAVMLYWLAPAVRYGRGAEPRIASDILDHPQREEIARVVNVGLLSVEPSVHRFAPERAVTRGEALEALLRLLGGAASEGAEPVPCATEVPLNRRPTAVFVCDTAAACGLLTSPGDCLPRAPLSGAEALELIRRARVRLGG